MYSLDNLWDGLGSLIDIYPEAKYYFGKVTMYPQLERTSRDMILYFMQNQFPDKDHLVTVRPELNLPILADPEWLASVFNADNYRDNYKILVKLVRGSLGQQLRHLNAERVDVFGQEGRVDGFIVEKDIVDGYGGGHQLTVA